MNTFKTAVVVVVLLGSLYVYQAYFNQGDPPPPPPGVAWEDPQVDVGVETDGDVTLDNETYGKAVESTNLDVSAGGATADLGTTDGKQTNPTIPSPPPSQTFDNSPTSKQNGSTTGSLTQSGGDSQGLKPQAVSPGRSQLSKTAPLKPGGTQDRWTKGIRRARPFDAAMKSARRHLAKKDHRAALYGLSLFHNSPDLSAAERKQLLDLLDPLAGKVIYSREHFWKAYEVGRNETLQKIAKKYQVPWQLLAKINGIRDPKVLVPNIKLKVVPGPFTAEVDLDRREITVFANVYLYAGRFSFEVGNDPKPQPGTYQVVEKLPGRNYFRRDGTKVPVGFPANPYGDRWIGLGGRIGFHGTPKYATRQPQESGFCMRLSARDADDLYSILSKESSIKIEHPSLNARRRASRIR